MEDDSKLAYALYIEDAYTYGAPKKEWRELAKLDQQTYLKKADRIARSMKDMK